MKFPVIVCDPPWDFECWGKESTAGLHGRTASSHYLTQTSEWIASLPIQEVASPDCVLFLWMVWPRLQETFPILEAWGFTYKTLAFDWVKVTSAGNPRIGMGYWTRANSEPCLLATKGKPKRIDKGVGQVIVSGLGSHSEKPEEMYERIERLVEGPYLELFHRPRNGLFPPREKWRFLGNAVDGKDIRVALSELAQE